MPSKKIIHSLLNSITSISQTPEELSEKLLSLGLEIGSIEDTHKSLKGFVVGEVLSKVPHENADKLSVCSVSIGAELAQVVCGAPNVAAGQKICFAPVGTFIETAGFKIEKRKIRGVESQGMICSEKELGLGESHDGILVLPAETPIGMPLSELLGDVVYDLDITPNRGDCLSHLGLAREIAAYTGNPITMPDANLEQATEEVSPAVDIVIEEPNNCPRYTARVVKNVVIQESPDWLKSVLKKIGVKPRNNIVDVASYVMFLCGHPLHAFDYDKIVGEKIVVKSSLKDEKFTTLDSKQHTLPEGVLLICDAEKPVALAGIMGGENSEITSETKNVLIESAFFNPSVIRRGARLLGISSDASYRFERAADINITEYACNLCATLLLELANGELNGNIIDEYPLPYKPHKIRLRFARTKQVVGINISNQEQVNILQSLFEVTNITDEYAEIIAPSYRTDIVDEIDLVEEVARMNDYQNIPVDNRAAVSFKTFIDPVIKLTSHTRNFFIQNGFSEIISMNFTDPETADKYGNSVKLKNALGLEFSALRTSHAPTLARTISYNQRRNKKDIKIFEVGKAFRTSSSGKGEISGIVEMLELSVAITGAAEPTGFDIKERNFDLFDLRGIIDKFLASLSIRNVTYTHRTEPQWGFAANSLSVHVQEIEIGRIGYFDEYIIKKEQVEDSVVAIFDLLRLAELSFKTHKYIPQSKFPSVVRDISFLIDKKYSHSEIEKVITNNAGEFVNQVRLFDLYEGKNIPSEKKSVAYSITFVPKEKTFTENEIDNFMKKIISSLSSNFQAELRS